MIGFYDRKAGDTEPCGFFSKTFSIPSSEYGTAFKSRIKQAEAKLAHHCSSIKSLPGNKLEIILTTHDAGTYTEKDTELARLINLAYDPHGTNKGVSFSTDPPPANRVCAEPQPAKQSN